MTCIFGRYISESRYCSLYFNTNEPDIFKLQYQLLIVSGQITVQLEEVFSPKE